MGKNFERLNFFSLSILSVYSSSYFLVFKKEEKDVLFLLLILEKSFQWNPISSNILFFIEYFNRKPFKNIFVMYYYMKNLPKDLIQEKKSIHFKIILIESGTSGSEMNKIKKES